MLVIDIIKDFSDFPFGMYRTDGKHSGQHFLEDLLLPLINSTDKNISIDLRSVKYGLGSSFLIAAFSYITKHINPRTGKNYTTEEFKSQVSFLTEDLDDLDMIYDTAKEVEISILNNKARELLSTYTKKEHYILSMPTYQSRGTYDLTRCIKAVLKGNTVNE